MSPATRSPAACGRRDDTGVPLPRGLLQVINLAEEAGAVVRIIDGTSFTDEVKGIPMAQQETSPNYPGGSFCCMPVEREAASR